MSLFKRNSLDRKPLSPYSPERIEHEIAHLRNRGSVRDPNARKRSPITWLITLAVLGLLWLYFMDPVLHSFRRGDAIHAYLYLHNFGSERKAQALADSGIFTAGEVQRLNHRQGSFQDYYSGPDAAERSANSVISYLQGVSDLQNGRYANLDFLGKVRYQLFVRFGILPPIQWAVFDPSIEN
jgi:hypothetical protein